MLALIIIDTRNVPLFSIIMQLIMRTVLSMLQIQLALEVKKEKITQKILCNFWTMEQFLFALDLNSYNEEHVRF